MAEARQLKTGRWRIYHGPEHDPVRDPHTGAIATFDSLAGARHWWSQLHPDDPSLPEANKCCRCGAYFGTHTQWTLYAGRPYHVPHAPERQKAG